jgi:hypothetical protein
MVLTFSLKNPMGPSITSQPDIFSSPNLRSSIMLQKQNTNNGNIKNVEKAMPAKFYPSAGSSMFSNARHLYVNNSSDKHIKRWQPISSGERTYMRSAREIGESSIQSTSTKQEVSFRSKETNSIRTALTRVRGGGTVAPKKKGANSAFKSGGSTIMSRGGNRQIIV